tara:strand:+ start:56 stop:706 length:651 start_codon:yes stop_codon:yes gene_type:complete
MKRILVINPNSTQAVTDAIDEALIPLRFGNGPTIDCETLHTGPPGIETMAHVSQVITPLSDLMTDQENSTDAFVIACYSDPGLVQARKTIKTPVFGIAESSMLYALTRGNLLGVISLFPNSAERHSRYVAQLGLTERVAGDLPVYLGVVELQDSDRAYNKLRAVGRTLIHKNRADILLLGCAGMARYRKNLEADLGVPVVDPTHAAVTMAIGTICT